MAQHAAEAPERQRALACAGISNLSHCHKYIGLRSYPSMASAMLQEQCIPNLTCLGIGLRLCLNVASALLQGACIAGLA